MCDTLIPYERVTEGARVESDGDIRGRARHNVVWNQCFIMIDPILCSNSVPRSVMQSGVSLMNKTRERERGSKKVWSEGKDIGKGILLGHNDKESCQILSFNKVIFLHNIVQISHHQIAPLTITTALTLKRS